MSRPTMAATPMSPLSLPPVFPPGTDPETYKIGEVTRLLKAAAYFPIFNVHNPGVPNQTVPLLPVLDQQLFVAINVNEALHRFEVVTQVGPQGLTASNRMSEGAIAGVQIRWTTIPDDYAPGPTASHDLRGREDLA